VSLDNPLQLVIVQDLAQSIDPLSAGLTSTEQRQAKAQPTERRRRHFVLGRLAAHVAVRRALGTKARHSSIEVLTGSNGEPLVQVAGVTDVVSVSLSHAGRLAVACTWLSASGYSAGVDLERTRPTEVAQSEYAFSHRERTLLSHLPEGQMLAGLAAWTVKEAVWKALWPAQCPNPAEIEIRALSLATGRAAVEVGDMFLTRFGDVVIRARVDTIDGPDGAYLLAVAEVASRKFLRHKRLLTYTIQPGLRPETIQLPLAVKKGGSGTK